MKRKFNFKDEYFEQIDTEAKAYFLGLLFADGNVYKKRHRVQITLANEDAYILQEFANELDYSGKLYSDRGKYSKLILPSKRMCDDLYLLGCTERKSLTLKFPNRIPAELMNHFIRGCFDGDGHISKRGNCFNINFTSSEDFITGFVTLMKSLNLGVTEGKKRYKTHKQSAFSTYINAGSARQFIRYIYTDASFFLKRKKIVADEPDIPRIVQTCKICNDKHFAKGLCRKHYRNDYYKINQK